MQVKALFEEVLQGDLDPAIAFKVQKMYKATDKAMAGLQIQQSTNDILLEALNEKKKRRGQENATLGNARVMGQQFLFEQQHEKDRKEYEATLKAFCHLGPFLFNTIPGQRAKPKPKPMPMPKSVASLAKKTLGTADVFATPRKRGRPRKMQSSSL